MGPEDAAAELGRAQPPLRPAKLLDYGIDQVCTNPERFASDVSTVEWLLRNMPKTEERLT